MGQKTPFRLLASQSLPVKNFPEALEILHLEDWISQDPVLWVGNHPLCALVAESDMQKYARTALADHFRQMHVTVVEVEDEASEDALVQLVLTQVLAAMKDSRAAENSLRSESAALRADYMQLQQSFVATEDFLYNAFAPSFVCAREWQPFIEQEKPVLDLGDGSVIQRLPVGSKGLVAVDVWMTGAGMASLTLCRQNGASFGSEFELKAEKSGWVRAQLEAPLEGLEEDVWISVRGIAVLALAQPGCLQPLFARQENVASTSPLAMRVWKGLPGVRVPETKPGPQRHIIPASDLPDPQVQGGGRVKRLRGRDAFALLPAHNGRLDLVFKAVPISAAANVAIFAQNFGPETARLSISLSEESNARPIYLQAECHGQCDLDIPSPGPVDIYVKLQAPSPVASVFIRGLEICPVVG